MRKFLNSLTLQFVSFGIAAGVSFEPAFAQSNFTPHKEGFAELTRKFEIPKSVSCKNFAVEFFPMKRGYYTNKDLITAPVFSAAIVKMNGKLDVATIASYGVPYDLETNTWVFSFHTSGWMITNETGQCICGEDRMTPSCPKEISIQW